ncbi:MAG: hypothetical protein HUU50_23225 [Candidatus Brocadiae bacterium]|nr:hypothetical protein [Candidatus Brocadiia bacterium]
MATEEAIEIFELLKSHRIQEKVKKFLKTNELPCSGNWDSLKNNLME